MISFQIRDAVSAFSITALAAPLGVTFQPNPQRRFHDV